MCGHEESAISQNPHFKLRLARRPRRDVSVDELERPFDRFDDHRLHLGSVPVGFDVAERGIEDAALAVHLGPRDREVAVLAMHARIGEVQLRRDRAASVRASSSLEKSLI